MFVIIKLREKMLVRERYLSQIREYYHSDLVKVLTGIRCGGKSVLLAQIMEELLTQGVSADQIISLSFEHLVYEEATDYQRLYEYLSQQLGAKKFCYLFLDEIQYIANYEKVIELLLSTKPVSIFITASNSRLLFEELSTSLAGRYVSFTIYPLSFQEVLQLQGKNGGNEVDFLDYLKWGGLPNRFAFENEQAIKNYLFGVYDSILLRDVIRWAKIRDLQLFNTILQYILDTVGQEFSASSIIEFLKQGDREISNLTIYSYLDALCKAFIITKAPRYDVRSGTVLKNLGKYYATDLGIAGIKKRNREVDIPTALQNVVYNELLVRGYEVYTGKTNKGSLDFIALKNDLRFYIQVDHLLGDQTQENIEHGSFPANADHLSCYVISMDETDYSTAVFTHLNIIDFLLGDNF